MALFFSVRGLCNFVSHLGRRSTSWEYQVANRECHCTSGTGIENRAQLLPAGALVGYSRYRPMLRAQLRLPECCAAAQEDGTQPQPDPSMPTHLVCTAGEDVEQRPWRSGSNTRHVCPCLSLTCSALTALSAAGEDIEKRAALEKRFQELCDREAALMAEIATLRKEVEA